MWSPGSGKGRGLDTRRWGGRLPDGCTQMGQELTAPSPGMGLEKQKLRSDLGLGAPPLPGTPSTELSC